MANQSNRQGAKQQRPARSSGINATFLGLIFLGICILISGLSISGSLGKLNKTMTEKTFVTSNSVNVPDNMDISQKKYLTEAEAGEYLNLSTEKIVSLINSGDINEYIKTDTGYAISVKVLDEWFDNEAYQNMLKYNASKIGANDDDSEDES